SSGTVFRWRTLQGLSVPRFDERCQWAADFDFWSRLLSQGALVNDVDEHVTYRVRAGNVTNATDWRVRQNEAWLISTRTYLRNLTRLGPVNAVTLFPWAAYKASRLLTEGVRRQTRIFRPRSST